MRLFIAALSLALTVGPTAAHGASCPALLQKMGEENGAHQVQRFKIALSELLEAFEAREGASGATRLKQTKDLRAKIMTVSEMLEVYVEYYGKELTPILRALKQVNSAVGETADMMHFSDLFSPSADRFPKTAKRLRKEAELQQEELTKTLNDEGWTSSKRPAMKDLIRDLADLKALKSKKDRRYLVDSVTAGLKAVETKDYPLDKVEEGLHALRKDIRKVLLVIQSSGGQLLLHEGNNPLPETTPLLTSWVANSKYARVLASESLPEVANPVQVPKGPYLQLVLAVELLGASKDVFQAREVIAKALLASGEVSKRGEAETIATEILNASPTYSKLEAAYGDLLAAGRQVAETVLRKGGSIQIVKTAVAGQR